MDRNTDGIKKNGMEIVIFWINIMLLAFSYREWENNKVLYIGMVKMGVVIAIETTSKEWLVTM